MLEAVEASQKLKYVLIGHFLEPDLETYPQGSDVPDLATADFESSICCATYLVCQGDIGVNVRRVESGSVVCRYCVDQLLNEHSVTLTPAGIRTEEILLHGPVATASESVPAQRLMKQFHSAFRKGFQKVRAFYVGPQASALWDAGVRLTAAVECPHEFDLRR